MIGVSGYVDFAASYEFTLRVHYLETYDIATNTSEVTITKVEILSSFFYNNTYYLDGTIKINGITAVTMSASAGYHGAYVEVRDRFYEVSGEFGSVAGIVHSNDGSKYVTIDVSVSGITVYGTAETGSGWHVSSSVLIALTTIPRASELSVENGTLGVAQKLTVKKTVDSFTHTITYQCGSMTGEVCENSPEPEMYFSLPLDLASQNTNGTSVAVTFFLQTYSGGSPVGDAVAKTVSMNIPDSVTPKFTFNITDNAGYKDIYGDFVKSLSMLNVVIVPELAYGSEIFSYSIVANGASYNAASIVTDVLKTFGTMKITATVIDNRGRMYTDSVDIEVIDYIAPVISKISSIRCNSDGTSNPQGTHLKVIFSASITPLNNKNTASYEVGYRKSTASDLTKAPSSAMPSAYAVNDFSYIFPAESVPYVIEVTAADNHSSMTRTAPGSAALFLIVPHESGNGLGLGMIPIHEGGLDLGFDVFMNGKMFEGKTVSWRDNGDGTFTLIGN